MFRVPEDPDNPKFEHTFQVSFGRWMTSSGAERKEWMRRRTAAVKLAGERRQERITQHFDQTRATLSEEQDRTAQARPQPQVIQPVDGQLKTLGRLYRLQLWASSIQLVLYVGGLLIIVGVVIAVVIAIATS